MSQTLNWYLIYHSNYNLTMLEFTKKYACNFYSQNGEDGIIDECLKRLRMTTGVCVEYGAADGYFCSNTRALIDAGWTGHLFEPGTMLPGITDAVILPENINQILPTCQVLSIDTDGRNDYDCFTVLEQRPDIVIIEINSSIPPAQWYVDEGAGYRSMLELGIKKGYFLLCHTGNLIFIKNEHREMFPEIQGNGVGNFEHYFKTDWL